MERFVLNSPVPKFHKHFPTFNKPFCVCVCAGIALVCALEIMPRMLNRPHSGLADSFVMGNTGPEA